MKKIKLIPLTTAAVLAALVGVNTVNAQEFTKTEIADFAKYELDGEVQYDDVYVIGKYIFKNFITMNDIMNASKDLGDKPNIVYYRNSVTGEWSNVNPEVNEIVNITDEDASFEIKVKKDETTQTASGWEYIVLEDPAIISALEAKVAEAEALEAENYTEPSYAVLTEALGMEAGSTDESRQAKIDAITEAISKLVSKADVAELEALKEEVQNLVVSNYTEESYTVLSEALLLPETTKEEIDAKVTALTEAVEQLVFSNQKTLDDLIQKYEALVKTDYTLTSYNSFSGAYLDTKKMAEDTYTNVSAKIKAMQSLESLLEKKDANLTELNKLINTNKTENDEITTDVKRYTEASYNAYLEVVTAAEELTVSSLQSVVDKAVTDINAKFALLETTNNQALLDKKAEIDALDSTLYTDSTYAKITTALELPETTYEQKAAKITALETAKSGLITNATDTALKVLLDEKPNYEELQANQEYTTDSYKALTDAYDLSVTDEQTAQNKINAINEAIEGLEFDGAKALQTIKDTIEGLNEADYTEESWAAYQMQMEKSNPMEWAETNNTEIKTKTIALNKLVENLEKVSGDLTLLDAKIKGQYTNGDKEGTLILAEADYTEESWLAYTTAIENADQLTAANLQSEIDDAITNIENKKAALVFANQAALDKAVEDAEKLEQLSYTPESWAALETALNNAQNVATNLAAGEAKTAIDNAVKALVPTNRPTLESLIATVNELKAEDYSVDSFQVLDAAITEAEEAVKSSDSSVIAAAIKNINDAKAALITKETADELKKLEDAFKLLIKEEYTTASYDAYEAALNAEYNNEEEALTVINNIKNTVLVFANQANLDSLKDLSKLNEEDYTKTSWKALTDAIAGGSEDSFENINAKIEAITNARKTLVLVNQQTLNDLKFEVNALVRDHYTNTSLTVLDNATSLPETTLNEVNSKIEAIQNAIASLVPSNKETLTTLKTELEGLNSEEYTEASWTLFTEAYEEALLLPEGVYETIANKLKALNNAKKALVFVNLEEFTTLKTNVQTIVDGFDADTTNEAEVALKTALQTATDADVTTYAKIEAAHQALNDAKIAYETATATPTE